MPDLNYGDKSATFTVNQLSNWKMEDDRSLVSGILSGDLKAYRSLIRQNERLVAHMVGRLVKHNEDREEICQDVFLRVYEKINEFNFRSKLSTWIATIAFRQAMNFIKKKNIQFIELTEENDLLTAFSDPVNPESVMEEKDMHQMIIYMTDRLPPHYKTALMLFHVDGMSYAEISRITGMPEGTVKSYIFRARNLLKQIVMKYLGKEELS